MEQAERNTSNEVKTYRNTHEVCIRRMMEGALTVAEEATAKLKSRGSSHSHSSSTERPKQPITINQPWRTSGSQ